MNSGRYQYCSQATNNGKIYAFVQSASALQLSNTSRTTEILPWSLAGLKVTLDKDAPLELGALGCVYKGEYIGQVRRDIFLFFGTLTIRKPWRYQVIAVREMHTQNDRLAYDESSKVCGNSLVNFSSPTFLIVNMPLDENTVHSIS
jgi:hypothetical protein